MTKRPVLSILAALILFFSCSSTVNADSSFWTLLFKAPGLLEQAYSYKDELSSYLYILDEIKQGRPLAGSSGVEGVSDQVVSSVLSVDEVVSEPTTTTTPTFMPAPTEVAVKTSDTPTPSKVPAVASTGHAQFIMGQINAFRSQNGMSVAATDANTCSFAALRAKELSASFSHSGFSSRRDSGSLPYPSWSYVTENIAMNSDYKDVFNQWKNSSGHANNMLGDTPYICVRKFGDYYAMEGLRP